MKEEYQTPQVKTFESDALKGLIKDVIEKGAVAGQVLDTIVQHPDFLSRQIQASIIGGADIRNFSENEKKAIEIAAQALAESNISLATGGYTGTMEEASRVHTQVKEAGKEGKIILSETLAITLDKRIYAGEATQWAMNRPQKSLDARLEILAKGSDIVIATKGSGGTMRELYTSLVEDWPKKEKRRFIIAFGSEHTPTLVRGLANTRFKNRRKDVYYIDWEDFNSRYIVDDLRRLLEIFYKEIYIPDGITEDDRKFLDEFRFTSRLKKDPLLGGKVKQRFNEELESIM